MGCFFRTAQDELERTNGYLKNVSVCQVEEDQGCIFINHKDVLLPRTLVKVSTCDKNGVRRISALGYVSKRTMFSTGTACIKTVVKFQEIKAGGKYVFSFRLTMADVKCLYKSWLKSRRRRSNDVSGRDA